jgi:hypothetical protein
MNSKLSMWKLLLSGATCAFLVTNCTIKSDSGKATGDDDGSCTKGAVLNGCSCPGNVKGHQACLSSGVYGSCICPASGDGGAPSDNGGASSVAGKAGYGGGYSAGDAGSGGEAGVDGAKLDPTQCALCLARPEFCGAEFNACAAEDENHPPDPALPDEYCLSSVDAKADQKGQIEAIIDCITTERANGLVKRDIVRACGSSLGTSADPTFFMWPPTHMTAATENLMNCMADAPDDTMPGDWANDPANFPDTGPRPWDDGTCAKLACTSKLPVP